jgi:hypothetical protein
MASLKAGFIFVAPEADYQKNRAVVETPIVELTVVGCKDYADAVKTAQEMVAEGIGAIELCAGFGVIGTAKIKEAVGNKAVVGAVRFDNHPGLEFKSGDEIF